LSIAVKLERICLPIKPAQKLSTRKVDNPVEDTTQSLDESERHRYAVKVINLTRFDVIL
jgi:hypothetical protein